MCMNISSFMTYAGSQQQLFAVVNGDPFKMIKIAVEKKGSNVLNNI